jgi:hypothetical protein
MNETDTVYYNVELRNDSDKQFSFANFNQNRTQDILAKPNDYELAVIGFSIPGETIPIQIWNNNQRDLNVSMRFGATTINTPLVFVQNTSPAISNLVYGDAIWSYQDMVNMVNVALQTSYTALKLAEPTAPPTEAPYFTYNSTTQLITYHCEQLYDIAGPPTIQVIMGMSLTTMFANFPYILEKTAPPIVTGTLAIKDFKNNTATIGGKLYYSTLQTFPSLELWSDFETILFETDSIPVSAENIGAQANIRRHVLTDFKPGVGINNRQSIQFLPRGPLRYYNLTSDYPLRSINMKAFWQSVVDGRVYPIVLTGKDVVSVKIMFKKKLSAKLEVTFAND